MEKFDRHSHWENIYKTRHTAEVSWYQQIPETSLTFFKKYNVEKTAGIIDVGGGDSFLADCLIEAGYTNISVLDISETAIDKARVRLGDSEQKVRWIVSDITRFESDAVFDFWHDRAAFHFLTDPADIARYIAVLRKNLRPGGIAVIATFSQYGPEKCSGINIKQYSSESMETLLKPDFELLESFTTDHITPFEKKQNFLFCCFRRVQN